MIISKRGQMTINQIVAVILLLGAGAIILLFFQPITELFSSGGVADRETCKLSVVARGTAVASSTGTQDIVPLRCTTEKVCLSESGDEDACKQFAGEQNIRGVAIDLNKPDQAAYTIMKESADAMYWCWQTMGEGRLDLFNTVAQTTLVPEFSTTSPMCVVCSRIAIDEDLWDNPAFKENIISRIQMNQFLSSQRIDESIEKTYLQSFSDVGVSFPTEVFNGQAGATSSELAVLFSQIRTETTWQEAAIETAGIGLVGFGSTFFTPAGVLTKNPYVATLALLGIGASAGVSAWQADANQEISTAYCGAFSSSKEAKNGCSVVRFVDWNAKSINSLCSGGIEGNL